MDRSSSYHHLLSPGRIGSLETRNRIVMAPMGSNLAGGDGRIGERIIRYYEERAAGGVGLIIMGVGAIAYPAGACTPNQVAISDDRFVPGLKKLTDGVHARGAKVAIQLQHAGKVAVQDIAAGRPMWVPSVPPLKAGDLLDDLTQEEVHGVTAYLAQPGAAMSFHEMTADDIRQVVAMFANAADRARRAGFDGVEIHAAHGYLLSSFLSPAYNKREDDYGGPLENRARLMVEVIRAVRARVGPDFPVWCRLDGKEFRTEGGITVEEAQQTAEIAEAAGVDAIHVTAYADPTKGAAFTDAPLVQEPGGYVSLAEGIKRRVKVPVIAVGRIEPEEADAIIAAGKADFVAMARKLLADPELPRKLEESRPQAIRPCVYCYTCVGKIYLNQRVSCAVNPATGREVEFQLHTTTAPKRVLVAGGGPAGMEAARVAALRGHKVILCEKSNRLGGTLFFASLVYEPNGRLIDYLEEQVRSLPIDVRLNQEVTPQLVKALAPDVVLVAIGARRQAPAIRGADRPSVLSGDDLRGLVTGDETGTAAEKLALPQRAMLGLGSVLGISDSASLLRKLSRRWMPVGKRVVIIGGGLVGIELADFLSERGRTVTVLERGQKLGVEMALPRRWRNLYELRERNVTMLTGVRVEEITDSAVVYMMADDTRHSAPTDSVIIASGAIANHELGEALAGVVSKVHVLGDCGGIGYIEGALMDAARVARMI
jgi:2,4-dienoyl-CoA reductase-like NADH-dependent reductase (Old Yellow Enzyme family)/ribulose 1,5-bisphosphate synthetase/thiazole synthase